MSNKYKVGDTIYITKDAEVNASAFAPGTRTVVVEADEHAYCVQSEDGTTDWLYYSDIDFERTESGDAENAQYLVYSPDSLKAPSKWYFTHSQARFVARKMAAEHRGTFYVLKATEKYSVGEVTKEVL